MMSFGAQLKRVIVNLSNTTGLDFIDPKISIFETPEEANGFTKISALHALHDFKAPTIDPKKCIIGLTKILYLLNRGQEFAPADRDAVFFACTRLFQSSSLQLRRLLHVLFRTLKTDSEISLMITSSLNKDLTSDSVCLRANALRTIVHILTHDAAIQFERQINTAIVSEKHYLSATALMACFALNNLSPDLLRKLHIVQKIDSADMCVQANAVLVMGLLNQNDKLSMHRCITQYKTKIQENPLAELYMTAHAKHFLSMSSSSEDSYANLDQSILDYLNFQLQRSIPTSPMVGLEIAKTVLSLALDCPKYNTDPEQSLNIPGAINKLLLIISDDNDVVRYACIKALYYVAQRKPNLLGGYVESIEPLMNDTCKPVAVLALITLLKTNPERESRLFMKQVSELMTELTDTQKIEVIKALEESCVANPDKIVSVIKFISSQLRDEGGKQAKTCVARTMARLSKLVPGKVHDDCLNDFCDFIEDCEHTSLMIYILAFLAREIPQSRNPCSYLRYLLNRAILETADVRAAAVTAMTDVALAVPSLKKPVIASLKVHMLKDIDDEVREIVSLSLRKLQPPEDDSDASTTIESLMLSDTDDSYDFSVDALIEECSIRIQHPEKPLLVDLKELPTNDEYMERKMDELKRSQSKAGVKITAGASPQLPSPSALVAPDNVNKLITETISKLSNNKISIQSVDASSEPMPLTETQAEYLVQAIKYICNGGRYIVVQIQVTNTLPRQTLEHVRLAISKPSDPSLHIVFSSEIPEIFFDTTKSIWLLGEVIESDVMESLADDTQQLSDLMARAEEIVIGTKLQFELREEGDEDAYADEYPMRELKIRAADLFSLSQSIPPPRSNDIIHEWALLENEQSVLKITYPNTRDQNQILEAIRKFHNSIAIDMPFSEPGQVLIMTNIVGAQPVFALFHVVQYERRILARVSIRSHNMTAIKVMSAAARRL